MELTIQQTSELKKELISAYKKAGLNNCLGSVEKTVEELFELRNEMVKKEMMKNAINTELLKCGSDTVKFRPR